MSFAPVARSAQDQRTLIDALIAERARRALTHPLSSAQLRMWLIEQHTGPQPLYHVTRAFAATGPLDTRALERSVDVLVARHAVLRTTYHYTDSGPVQSVGAAVPFRFERADLRAIEPPACAGETQRLIAGHARRPFRLDADPMLRAMVVQLAPDRHVVAFTFHHIAVDEWSLDVFFTELRIVYAAVRAGREPVLPSPGMEYTAFARWEAERNASDATAQQLTYWQTRLAGATAAIPLPYARSRPERSTGAGASRSAMLAPAHVAAFTQIARRAGATPFMTYLAAFAAGIHELSGAADFVVGTPVSVRRGAQLERTLGMFGNAVALRFDLRDGASFGDWVAHARSAVVEAFENRDAPFERVVTAVTNRRTVNANPVFHVAFTMQSAAGFAFALDDLAVEPLELTTTTTKFDICAVVSERSDGVELALQYSTELFDDATIGALLDRFVDLLARVCTDPCAIISVAHPPRAVPAADAVTPAAASAAARPSEARPADAVDRMVHGVRDRLRALWESVLGVGPIADNDDFFVLGGHSLLAFRLIARVEETLGTRIPMAAFFADPTIAGLARALVAEAREPATSPLVVLRRGSQLPLIVFHGDYTAGGLYLRDIIPELGDRTVYALPPHGSDGGDVPPSIEAMAADRIALLRREGIAPPFDLAGYCNGGLVALEVARQLTASGVPPPRVFVISADVFDPAILRVTALADSLGWPLHASAERRTALALRLLRWHRAVRASGPRVIGEFIAEEVRWALARRRRRRADPGHPDASPPPRSLLAIYGARLVRYRPGPYAGPLVVFRPRGDAGRAPATTWTRINPSVVVEPIDGDHLSSITAYAPSLAQRLRVSLDR